MARVRVVLVAAMMVSMPACADDADGGPERPAHQPGDPATVAQLEGALAATQAIVSARIEVQTAYRGMAVPGGGDGGPDDGPDDVRMVQRAAFDRRQLRAQAETDMSELAAVVDASDEDVPGDYSTPTRLVIDGETVYAQLGPLADVVGLAPTAWVERDLASFAAQPTDNETAALLLRPLGLLELLRLPVEGVRVAGGDEVRGEPTTHLSITVDLAPAGGTDRGPAAEGADAIAARFRSLGLEQLPVDVWIGTDDQVVRRLQFAIDAEATGRASAGGLTTRVDVYDIDRPIEVTVPDPADVVDQAELRARAAGN